MVAGAHNSGDDQELRLKITTRAPRNIQSANPRRPFSRPRFISTTPAIAHWQDTRKMTKAMNRSVMRRLSGHQMKTYEQVRALCCKTGKPGPHRAACYSPCARNVWLVFRSRHKRLSHQALEVLLGGLLRQQMRLPFEQSDSCLQRTGKNSTEILSSCCLECRNHTSRTFELAKTAQSLCARKLGILFCATCGRSRKTGMCWLLKAPLIRKRSCGLPLAGGAIHLVAEQVCSNN